MKHDPSIENELITEATKQNFSFWLHRPYISQKLRNKLLTSDILIVPDEGIRDFKLPMFPVKTEEIFTFLRNNIPSDYQIDICIEDDDYKELALHHDLRKIGRFIVTVAVLPVLVSLLSSYLQDKMKHTDSGRAINVEIIVQEKDGSARILKYEGRPEDFRETITSLEKNDETKQDQELPEGYKE